MTKLNNIIEIMNKRNISFRYIAIHAGLNMSTIVRVANGDTIPSQITMMKISYALKLDTSIVFNLNFDDFL